MARRNHGATQSLSSQPNAPLLSKQQIHNTTSNNKHNSLQEQVPNSIPSNKRNSNKSVKSARAMDQRTPSVYFQSAESEIQIVEVTPKETRIEIASSRDSPSDSTDQSSHAWKRKRRRRPSNVEIRSAPLRKVEFSGHRKRFSVDILTGIISVFVTIAVSVPISLVILIILPMAFLVKTLGTSCFHPRVSGCCHYEYLSSHDAYFFSQESQPVLHSVLIIDGSLPLARIRQVVTSRVIDAKNASGELMYPRFSDCVKILPAGPAWKKDESFHIHHHIYLGHRVSSKSELEDYISELTSKPLPMERPLWEIVVVGASDDCESKDTVLVCRVHPCISDGISLMRLLCNALSDNHMKYLPSKPHFASITYATAVIFSFLYAPLTLIKWIFFWPVENNLLTHSYYFVQKNKTKYIEKNLQKTISESMQSLSPSNNRNLNGERQKLYEGSEGGYVVKYSSSVSLPKVNRVKLVTRTTLNDVLLSTVSGALRIALQKRGLDNPPDLSVSPA